MAGSNSTPGIWSVPYAGRYWVVEIICSLEVSKVGGRRRCLYSVVQSARLHRLDVTAYLTDVLRRLPALLPTDAAAIGELLPDRWAQTHPEHVLLPRLEESRAVAASSAASGGPPADCSPKSDRGFANGSTETAEQRV